MTVNMEEVAVSQQRTGPYVNTSALEAKFTVGFLPRFNFGEAFLMDIFDINRLRPPKIWTLSTPLELYLNGKSDPIQRLKDLIRDYENPSISFQKIISEVPPSSGWIHNALPRFRTFANQQFLLLLGFCPQYGETILADGMASVAAAVPTTCFTDVLAGSVGRMFGHMICLCARKHYRKTKKLDR